MKCVASALTLVSEDVKKPEVLVRERKRIRNDSDRNSATVIPEMGDNVERPGTLEEKIYQNQSGLMLLDQGGELVGFITKNCARSESGKRIFEVTIFANDEKSIHIATHSVQVNETWSSQKCYS